MLILVLSQMSQKAQNRVRARLHDTPFRLYKRTLKKIPFTVFSKLKSIILNSLLLNLIVCQMTTTKTVDGNKVQETHMVLPRSVLFQAWLDFCRDNDG